MVGLIENQQAIQHSSTVEKIQQVKQENLGVYQEVSATEKKEKELRKQKTVNQSKESDDVVIRDKNRQRSGKDRGRKKSEKEKKEHPSKNKHKLDIMA